MHSGEEPVAIDSGQVATFNKASHSIPADAILVFGGSWQVDEEKIKPRNYITEDYLSATINLFNALIKKNLGSEFIAIIADSLAANLESSKPDDTLRQRYTESGTAYIKANQRYFGKIAFPANKKTITQWEQWRNDEIFRDVLGEGEKTSLKVLTQILDKTSAGTAVDSIKKIIPSMQTVIDYLNYVLDDENSPHHKNFSHHVNKEIGKRVADKFGNLVNQESSKDEIQDFKRKARNFIVEECAQHFILGILAHRLNKPIRVFYKGGLNGPVKFVQKTFIGVQWATGRYYLDVVDMEMFESKQSAKKYQTHPSLFNTMEELKKETKKGVEEKLTVLGSSPPKDEESFKAGPVGLLALARSTLNNNGDLQLMKVDIQGILEERKKSGAQKDDSKAHSPRFEFSSRHPKDIEVYQQLIRYFENDAEISTIENFLEAIDKKIRSRENSPKTPRGQRRHSNDHGHRETITQKEIDASLLSKSMGSVLTLKAEGPKQPASGKLDVTESDMRTSGKTAIAVGGKNSGFSSI